MSKYATNESAAFTVRMDISPDTEKLQAVRKPSDEFVRTFLGNSKVEWIVVSADADNATTVGGASAFFLSGWLNIQSVWVEPEYRNCGIGSQILNELEKAAKSRSSIGVRLVTTSFSNAHGLYARLGYKTDATWPISSEAGGLHDEIQMTKYLRVELGDRQAR